MPTPFKLVGADQHPVFVYHWPAKTPKAILFIAHGMMEHAKRYTYLAEQLNKHHISVYAHDHPGHGLTAHPSELGVLHNGTTWTTFVDTLQLVYDHLHAQTPHLPVFLLGHSMGSYLAQSFAIRYPNTLNGLILSGTSYEPPISTGLGRQLVRFLTLLQGSQHPAQLVHNLIFGGYNRCIEDPETPCDWLNRDEEAVQAYINDPYCGFTCSLGFYDVLFSGLNHLYQTNTIKLFPKTVPIYLFSGTADPLAKKTKSLKAWLKLYQQAGISAITHKFYALGRHEMLHETNKDDVITDLSHWLTNLT